MKKKICGVYKITNIVNGKLYVGSLKDIEYRWSQHRDELNKGTHGNPHLQRAWNKYGQSSFKFEVIEECEPSIQFEREQFYLNTLSPFDDNGYNIVRRISKEYMSDNYFVAKCVRCGKDYNTFSHLSKYCDKCKEEMSKESRLEFEQEKEMCYRNKVTPIDVELWGYDSWDDFWENNI